MLIINNMQKFSIFPKSVSIFPKSVALAEALHCKRCRQELTDPSNPPSLRSPLGRLLFGMELLESVTDTKLSIDSANDRNRESLEQMLPVTSTNAFRKKFFARALTESQYVGKVFDRAEQKELFTPYFDLLARFRDRFGDASVRQLGKTFPLFSIFSEESLDVALRRDYDSFERGFLDLGSKIKLVEDARTILRHIIESVELKEAQAFLASLEGPWPNVQFPQSNDKAKTGKFATAVRMGVVPELLEAVSDYSEMRREEREAHELAINKKAEKVKIKKEAKKAFRETIRMLGGKPEMLKVFELLRDSFKSKELSTTLNRDPVPSIVLTTCEALMPLEAGSTFKLLVRRYRRVVSGMLMRMRLRDYWEGEINREELDARLGAFKKEVVGISETSATLVLNGLGVTERIERSGIDAAISSHLKELRSIRKTMAIQLWQRYDEIVEGVVRRSTLPSQMFGQ